MVNNIPKLPIDRATGLSLSALLLGGVLIGLSPIFVRLSELGPVSTAFWRVGLAFLPLLAWRITQSSNPNVHERPRSLRDMLALIFPGTMLAGDLIAWHISITMTSVANATLLANLSPVFVMLGSWLLFGSIVSRRFMAALALAIAGVILLSSKPGSAPSGTTSGDAVAILAAIFYSGYLLSLAQLRARYSTLTTMLWTTGSAALCMLPVALVWEASFWPTTGTGWVILVALGWVCHVGGQGLIVYALALLPASFSSLTLLIQPIVAACVAWLVLHESLGMHQIAGGAIVILGILLARRG